jgi:hypothetical protein
LTLLNDENIEDVINNFSNNLLFFINSSHANPKGHYYLYFPANNSSFIVVTLITSTSLERIQVRHKKTPDASKSLYVIQKGDIDILYKKSIIDCNYAEQLTKEELLKIKDIKYVICEKAIKAEIYRDIIKCIKMSPIVIPAIKKDIEKYCMSVIRNLQE